MLTLRRWVLIMLVVMLQPGCSAIKLAYNQTPDLTYWWLDSYFDFNEQQTPKARDALAKLLVWHRSSELPKVVSLLQKAQGLVVNNVSNAQACELYDEARVMYVAIIDRALPAAAELAPALTAEQLAHMQRKFQKINDEYTRDYIASSAAERSAKRLKSAINRSEMVYGKLEAAQTAAIERAIAASSFDPAFGLKERQQRQKEALEMLTNLTASKASPVAAQKALSAYLARSLSSSDPAYRAYADKMVRESCESFAAVHATTTPAQRANAVQTLKGYEQDMRTLASQN
jgi:Family of unknown function (DUF6279)